MKRNNALTLVSILTAVPMIAFVVTLLLPHRISDKEVGGLYSGKQIWSGDLHVTESIEIQGSLTILPGSTLTFEPEAGLIVHGNLKAEGSEERLILFSTAEAISFEGNKSHLNYVKVENSRQGLLALGEEKKSIIENSHFEGGLEGCLSSEGGQLRVQNNLFVDCGASALNLKGSEVVLENTIRGGEIAISVLSGTPSVENNLIEESGAGIYIEPGSEAKFLNNQVHLAK